MSAIAEDQGCFQVDAGDPPYICAECGKPVHIGDGALAYRFYGTGTSIVLHDSCALPVVARLANDLSALSEPFCMQSSTPEVDRWVGHIKKCHDVLYASFYGLENACKEWEGSL